MNLVQAMPKCSIHAEPGDDPDDDQKSYSSYNFAYQLQDMQLDSEQSVRPGMEFKVGMGINIRPPASGALVCVVATDRSPTNQGLENTAPANIVHKSKPDLDLGYGSSF
jgi:hypothetical protein